MYLARYSNRYIYNIYIVCVPASELDIPILCGDNQGAIFLASNPAQEHRSKHIDIRYHYIRECVEKKKVILHYVPTTEQIADIMTKCLSYDKFKKFRNQLGITIP